MDCQKVDWNKSIKYWDASVYEKKMENLTLLEKAATWFRGKTKQRLDFSISFLEPYISGGRFFEFGCGCGRLGEKLLELGAAHYTGTDISIEAIKETEKRLARFGKSKFNLRCLDIAEMKNFENDPSMIYCGLGILQYLSNEELAFVFKIIKSSRFLFETHEFHLNFRTFAFCIYRLLRKHPYYKFVDISEIRKVMYQPEILQYKRTHGLSFIFRI